MKRCLFLGDSITDSNHLFSDHELGEGYVAYIQKQVQALGWHLYNRGHDGFTSEQLLRMLLRDGIEDSWDIISILIGVNDIPVELYTNRSRIPTEFTYYYEQILSFLREHTSATVVLMEPFVFHQPSSYQLWEPYLQQELHIIKSLAKEFDALWIPSHQRMEQACLQHGISKITTDGIHLTNLGHQILGQLWIATLSDVL